MSILNRLSSSFKIATGDTKSSADEITELTQYARIEVPPEFLEIIKEKTEIEISVNNKKYIRIWEKWIWGVYGSI